MARPEYVWLGFNLPGKTTDITKYSMTFWRVLTHSVLYLCCTSIVTGLQCGWFCFRARRWLVKSLSAMCVLELWDLAFSRAARGNWEQSCPVQWGQRPSGQGRWPFLVCWECEGRALCGTTPSAFTYFSLSYSTGFWCCLLLSGPSSRLCKHRRHPSLCVWRHFSPSSWEHGMLHPLCDWEWEPTAPPGTSTSSFPQEGSYIASSFWCIWGGEITSKPTEQCSLVLLCLLHDSSPA